METVIACFVLFFVYTLVAAPIIGSEIFGHRQYLKSMAFGWIFTVSVAAMVSVVLIVAAAIIWALFTVIS